MFEIHKPRTNYKRARRAYLQIVKKAKKKGRMVRETIGVMQPVKLQEVHTEGGDFGSAVVPSSMSL